ncbi:PLDc N-terminal domain-containing protein [Algibacter pectinivorans]|uniref:Phospholipase_D-nuclease N-terminal n=1 Tax=Algibacter pectinivorans TaxID=870482 RepID=A0A1I1S4Y7_9FLAO|nr:PLD nuclease N-terminal domain-containing protein [Algibacter pectinivorans]SFD41585.1 Phospholipase_D-nuclease N-terminal [Algibacter pectinivorans]
MDETITEFSLGLFFWQALILISLGLWIFCLIDIIRNQFQKNEKITWTLIVILLPILGALLYLFIGKSKKLKQN